MQPALSDSGFVLKRYGRVTSGRYRLYGLRHDKPPLFIKEQAEELSPLSTAHVFEDEEVLGRRSNRSAARAADAEPPQDMDMTFGGALVGRLREKINVVGYELAIDFSMDAAHLLDRRLGLAVAVFAAFDKTKVE